MLFFVGAIACRSSHAERRAPPPTVKKTPTGATVENAREAIDHYLDRHPAPSAIFSLFNSATLAAFGELDEGATERLRREVLDAVSPGNFVAVIRLVRLLAFFWACHELPADPERGQLVALRDDIADMLERSANASLR